MKTDGFYVFQSGGDQYAFDAADAERAGVTLEEMADLARETSGAEGLAWRSLTMRVWTAALQSEMLAECLATIVGPNGPSFTTNWIAVPNVKCRLMVASWDMVDAAGEPLREIDRQKLGACVMAKVDAMLQRNAFPSLGALPDFGRALGALQQAKRDAASAGLPDPQSGATKAAPLKAAAA